MTSFSLIAGTFVVPAIILLINFGLRYVKRVPLSTGSDIAMAFVSFDFAAVIAHEDFRRLLAYIEFQKNILAILVVLGLIGIAVWVFDVIYFEKRILESYDMATRTYIGLQ